MKLLAFVCHTTVTKLIISLFLFTFQSIYCLLCSYDIYFFIYMKNMKYVSYFSWHLKFLFRAFAFPPQKVVTEVVLPLPFTVDLEMAMKTRPKINDNVFAFYVLAFSIEFPLASLYIPVTVTFLLQVKFPKIAHRTKLFTQPEKYILVLFNSYNLLSSTIIKNVHEVINLRSSLIWEQLVNKVLINISSWNTHKPKISWYFPDIEFLFKELLSHYTVWVHKVNLPLIIPKIPKQA